MSIRRKKFQQRKENFTCTQCGVYVAGTGYTNHCPKCLWSMHVDVYPGDRNSSCSGMMKPEWIEKDGKEYAIVHRCILCGHEKKNKVDPQDDFTVVVCIAQREAGS